VKVPLNEPDPPEVTAFPMVVQGPEVEVLYWRATFALLGTATVADTEPENATKVWPALRGVRIALSVVVVE
jgi:hypothetical protein